jgi:DNA-binding transcriptional regulator GbsR (MarR family)
MDNCINIYNELLDTIPNITKEQKEEYNNEVKIENMNIKLSKLLKSNAVYRQLYDEIHEMQPTESFFRYNQD